MLIIQPNDLTEANLGLMNRISWLEHEARELRHDITELEAKVEELRGIIKDNDRQRYIPRDIKDKVVCRDHGTCRYCGLELEYAEDIHFDHVYPWSKGGETTVENLVVSCETCNRKKGDTIGVWPMTICITENRK